MWQKLNSKLSSSSGASQQGFRCWGSWILILCSPWFGSLIYLLTAFIPCSLVKNMSLKIFCLGYIFLLHFSMVLMWRRGTENGELPQYHKTSSPPGQTPVLLSPKAPSRWQTKTNLFFMHILIWSHWTQCVMNLNEDYFWACMHRLGLAALEPFHMCKWTPKKVDTKKRAGVKLFVYLGTLRPFLHYPSQFNIKTTYLFLYAN